MTRAQGGQGGPGNGCWAAIPTSPVYTGIVLTLPGWSHRSSSVAIAVGLYRYQSRVPGTDTGTGRYQTDIDVGTGTSTRLCGGTDRILAPVDAF